MTTDLSRDHDSGETDRSVLPFEAPTDESRGSGVGRRLVVGFVLCCVIAGVCWGVLPRFGVWVPGWLPLAGFVLIVVAAVVAGPDRDGDQGRGGGPGGGCGVDEGRPICCSGPRLMRVFGERPTRPPSPR